MEPQWKQLPVRDKAYLAWIRKKPCLVCGYSGQDSVPHHENERGHGGRGTKTSDHRTLPVCRICHDYRHTQGRSCWIEWDIDPEAEIAKLQAEYKCE